MELDDQVISEQEVHPEANEPNPNTEVVPARWFKPTCSLSYF